MSRDLLSYVLNNVTHFCKLLKVNLFPNREMLNTQLILFFYELCFNCLSLWVVWIRIGMHIQAGNVIGVWLSVLAVLRRISTATMSSEGKISV